MKKALIAFSFDDGRLDNYTIAFPILKKYCLPATFNITTGYINNNIDREEFKFPEPMTVQMVNELYNNGSYEIAGHGCQHINTCEDIIKGIQELCFLFNTNMLTDKGNGFASPGSDLTDAMYKEMKPMLDSNNIKYVRVSCRYKSFRKLKIIFRKISRLVKWPWIYRIAYQDTLMGDVKDNTLYSIPILSSVTPEQLKAVILKAVYQKKCCILMFHSIVSRSSIRNTWDYSSEDFDTLCKMLSDFQSQNKLEVKTVMDVYSSLKQ